MGSGWPLVGRNEEIAEISQAIALPGGSGGVVLAGAAGVGKTRLAREALTLAQQQHRRCRWVVATGSARSVPLGAFAEFAENFGPDPICRIREVIEALVGEQPARHPSLLVVGIDDAHLLDDQSALVVYQLVRRRAATVVLTVRAGEVPPDAITSLWKDEGRPRIDLQPLSAREIAILVAGALGGDVESSSAERLWRYTRGNVLYLRQLLADEFACTRISKRSGLWVWDGHPDFSPTLIELIESNIGRHDESVIAVLDALSVADPLEAHVLRGLVPPNAISEAEARGLITIDGDSAVVRFAHPMFGEARRSRIGNARLRQRRGDIAEAVGALCDRSLHQRVRRAVLMLDSDREQDSPLLEDAAAAAMQLLDIRLALRLSRTAAEDGGRGAQLTYGWALSSVGRGAEAEAVYAALTRTASEGPERAHVAMYRAVNTAWVLGSPLTAERGLDDSRPDAQECGLINSHMAIRAACRVARGDPSAAVELADDALCGTDLDGFPAMFGWWGLVGGLGELGRVDRLAAASSAGYLLAKTSTVVSHLRFAVGLLHVDGLRLAGELDQATTVAAGLRRESKQMEVFLPVTAATTGLAELAQGSLDSAQRWLREAAVLGSDGDDISGSIRELSEVRLATALAMSGDRVGAQRILTDSVRFSGDQFRLYDGDRLLAQAWVHAANGLTGRAVEAATAAADSMRSQGRSAREVLCLQTATQFGATAVASRLTELAALVGGPRVVAATAHAVALRERDGRGLLAASQHYEAFGDRVAAADAAAQAAVVLRDRGLAGSALSAAAVVRRLGESCPSDTLALRALTTPSVLTDRQREIIALASTGLTNREIAERLVMSIRTVEGHLFRASQRAGVNTREELITLLEGRNTQRVDAVG